MRLGIDLSDRCFSALSFPTGQGRAGQGKAVKLRMPWSRHMATCLQVCRRCVLAY